MKNLEVLVWSDLHVHPWTQFNPIETDCWGRQIHSRILDAVEVIRALNRVCEYRGIKYRVFLGDLFHRRGEVHVPVMQLVMEAFYEAKKMGIQDFLLVGNHDLSLNKGFNSLSLLSDCVCEVVTEHAIMRLGNVLVSFHPWNYDRFVWRESYLSALEKCAHKLSVSFMHYDFRDVPFRGMQIGKGIASSVLAKNLRSFSGHYHDHIEHGNLVYVGSPLQHNWSDAGQRRGYCIVKFTGNVCTGYEYREDRDLIVDRLIPRFVVVRSLKELKKADVCQNFVRVVLPSFTSERKFKVERFLTKKKARAWELLEFVPEVTQDSYEDQTDPARNFSYKTLLKRYIDDQRDLIDGSLDRETLKSVGVSLLEE